MPAVAALTPGSPARLTDHAEGTGGQLRFDLQEFLAQVSSPGQEYSPVLNRSAVHVQGGDGIILGRKLPQEAQELLRRSPEEFKKTYTIVPPCWAQVLLV